MKSISIFIRYLEEMPLVDNGEQNKMGVMNLISNLQNEIDDLKRRYIPDYNMGNEFSQENEAAFRVSDFYENSKYVYYLYYIF